MSNLQEGKAREGKILAVATRGDADIGSIADEVILIPETVPALQPLLTVLPLQLLAYYVADFKGVVVVTPTVGGSIGTFGNQWVANVSLQLFARRSIFPRGLEWIF